MDMTGMQIAAVVMSLLIGVAAVPAAVVNAEEVEPTYLTPRPNSVSTLTVKAFDSDTGGLIPGAQALIIRHVSLPTKYAPVPEPLPDVAEAPVAVPSRTGCNACGSAGAGGGEGVPEYVTTDHWENKEKLRLTAFYITVSDEVELEREFGFVRVYFRSIEESPRNMPYGKFSVETIDREGNAIASNGCGLHELDADVYCGNVQFEVFEVDEENQQALIAVGETLLGSETIPPTDTGELIIKVVALVPPVTTAQGNVPAAVESGRTHLALSGAQVVVYGENARPVDRATTDKDGVVQFSLREGVYTVTVSKEGYTYHKQLVKVANGQTTRETVTLEREPTKPPTEVHDVVVAIIDADGQDSVTLRRGLYEIIVFAEGYTLYRHKVNVDGLRDYELKAPLRKEYSVVEEAPIGEVSIAIEAVLTADVEELPTVTVVKPKEGKDVVEITTEVVEEIETVSPYLKKSIAIRPVADKPEKLEIESEGFVATTDSSLEIEGEKLFAVKENRKAQIKIMPEEAHRIAHKGVGEVQSIELEVTDKPVYKTKKFQNANLFGFIPGFQYEEEAVIDATTGAVEGVNAPMWSMFAVPY